MMTEDPEEARKAFHSAAEVGAPICISCKKPVKHRKGLEWCQDNEMVEATLTTRVLYRAKKFNWAGAHAGRSVIPMGEGQEPLIITPMSPGWPDWCFAKPGHRLIFMELKTMRGKVSADQLGWLQLLNQTGNYGVVIRPSNLREGDVDAIFKHGAPL